MTNWNIYHKAVSDFTKELKTYLEKLKNQEIEPISYQKTWIDIQTKGFINPLSENGTHSFGGVSNFPTLLMYKQFRKYKDNRFSTVKQIFKYCRENNLRADISGNRPITMLFPIYDKKAKEENEKSLPSGFSGYEVINYDDIRNLEEIFGLPEPTPFVPIPESNEYNQILNYLKRENIEIEYFGNRACYIPALDKIQLPEYSQFSDEKPFLITAYHEVIHSTGNKNRINRPLSGKFGSPEYAFEELIAEISAHTIIQENKENSLAYCASWAKAFSSELKDKDIFKLNKKIVEAISYFENGKQSAK